MLAKTLSSPISTTPDSSICTEIDTEKEHHIEYFTELWAGGSPLCLLFRTAQQGYLYDTGTNRIVRCSDIEYTLLNDLMHMSIVEALDKEASVYSRAEIINALQDLRTSFAKMNLLGVKKVKQFGLSAHYHFLEEAINSSVSMIELEVTERCNLRCAYCIYEPHYLINRNHGFQDMSLETAYQAIDYLALHSDHTRKVGITFYGGEPLLRFPFIKKCVTYAHERIKNREIGFSMTTNATQISASIASYLSKEKFGISVSIDGPQEVHNQYRRDINGEGSYERTIAGLKLLLDTYGEDYKKISLSMVYSPPYSSEKIGRMAELWQENRWIPKDISSNTSYSIGFFPPSCGTGEDAGRDYSLFKWSRDEFTYNYRRGTSGHPIARNFLEKKLATLMQRPIYPSPMEYFHLNACCVPGVRKLLVSATGNFLPCERNGSAPIIGNVYRGVDLDIVKRIYVEEYEKASLPVCSTCWALQLCEICYMHTFSQKGIDIIMKNEFCAGDKQLIIEYLKLYCHLLEINDTGLDYLMTMKMS